MANLQVKNMPDELYERLRAHARFSNCSISAAVVVAVERELTLGAWRRHVAERPATYLVKDAATLLAEARSERGIASTLDEGDTA